MAPKSKAKEKKIAVAKAAEKSKQKSKEEVGAVVLLLEWSCHHDGGPATSDIIGVYSSAQAANDAALDQFVSLCGIITRCAVQ